MLVEHTSFFGSFEGQCNFFLTKFMLGVGWGGEQSELWQISCDLYPAPAPFSHQACRIDVLIQLKLTFICFTEGLHGLHVCNYRSCMYETKKTHPTAGWRFKKKKEKKKESKDKWILSFCVTHPV